MKKPLIFFIAGLYVCCISTLSCTSTLTIKPTVKSRGQTQTTPLTDECAMQEEVCQEALDFQKEYDRMPEEEQKDMASVLNTYIEHCENAKIACEKSKKK